MTKVERRLHQLMLSVRDFDRPVVKLGQLNGTTAGDQELGMMRRGSSSSSTVGIESCKEKGYSIVTVQCKDRPRLMFDTVCTLTDMQYVVFHASTDSHRGYAFQVCTTTTTTTTIQLYITSPDLS